MQPPSFIHLDSLHYSRSHFSSCSRIIRAIRDNSPDSIRSTLSLKLSHLYKEELSKENSILIYISIFFYDNFLNDLIKSELSPFFRLQLLPVFARANVELLFFASSTPLFLRDFLRARAGRRSRVAYESQQAIISAVYFSARKSARPRKRKPDALIMAPADVYSRHQETEMNRPTIETAFFQTFVNYSFLRPI